MKKTYVRPRLVSHITGLNMVPFVAAASAASSAVSTAASVVGVGAALAGGYAVGRAVKSIEVRVDALALTPLEKVGCVV